MSPRLGLSSNSATQGLYLAVEIEFRVVGSLPSDAGVRRRASVNVGSSNDVSSGQTLRRRATKGFMLYRYVISSDRIPE